VLISLFGIGEFRVVDARDGGYAGDVGEEVGFAGGGGGDEGSVGLAEDAEEEDVGGGGLVDDHDDFREELLAGGELDGEDMVLRAVEEGDVFWGQGRCPLLKASSGVSNSLG
jgi:hypothetical protein